MAPAGNPALADSSEPAWRTIVLKGATVPQLIGSFRSHLEVFALHDGHLTPIPFQVDKLLPNGRYVLPDGPEPAADDGRQILGRDDEIAMMLSDLGDHASPPPRELPSDALEIEVLDTARGTRRYAYIAAVPSPRLSRISYVRYDPALNTVEGESYRMTFRADFPTGLVLRDNDGNFSPSLIENSQLQVTARILRLFKLRLGVKGMTSRVVGWHQGPIRLIRRVSHSVKLIFGIKTPPVLSEEIFYRDRAKDSLVARVPWMPRLFFAHVRLRAWFDFNRPDGLSLSWPGDEVATPRARGGTRCLDGSRAERSAGGKMARSPRLRQNRDAHLRAVVRSRAPASPALLLRGSRRRRQRLLDASGLYGRRAANRVSDDRVGKSRSRNSSGRFHTARSARFGGPRRGSTRTRRAANCERPRRATLVLRLLADRSELTQQRHDLAREPYRIFVVR
jgi:hypothetical protein